MNNEKSVSFSRLSPFLEWLREQRNRRIIAAVYLADLAGLAFITWLIDSYWPVVPMAVTYVALMVLLAKSTRGIAGENERRLDERQISVRNMAYRYTYWPAVISAFVGGIVIPDISDSDTAFEVGLFLAVWGMVTALPTLFLAWTLSDEVADEE